MKSVAASLLTAVTLGASAGLGAVVKRQESDITPITVSGNAFWKGDERFYMRGVAYQPGGSSKVEDPLIDPKNCERDIPLFEELGLNTIRIYHVDNSKSHDECMQMLADAGIYLVLDVNLPKYSINRDEPEESYNDVYLQSVFATVEMFSQYKNTMAFFSGNEVVDNGPSSASAPYVKAVTRDIRQYIRSRELRQVPVGYSAADVNSNRLEMAKYMNCGPEDERSDFFAFNDYSWCSPSSFTKSGWDQKVKNFTDYGLPLFLSEYGCNTNDREWGEVEALYSDKMTPVYSGGLVYEFTQEKSDYGLYDYGKSEKLPDFNKLKKAFEKTANSEGDGGYNKDATSNECPEANPPNWDVDTTSLPAIPEPALKYMTDGAGDGPGMKGGSQNSGTKSSGTATPGSGYVSGAPTGSESTGNAAPGLNVAEIGFSPFIAAFAVTMSTLFGASLIVV